MPTRVCTRLRSLIGLGGLHKPKKRRRPSISRRRFLGYLSLRSRDNLQTTARMVRRWAIMPSVVSARFIRWAFSEKGSQTNAQGRVNDSADSMIVLCNSP